MKIDIIKIVAYIISYTIAWFSFVGLCVIFDWKVDLVTTFKISISIQLIKIIATILLWERKKQ